MPVQVHAVDHPQQFPFTMPDRFRRDVTYFATPPGVQDAPTQLSNGEYWIRADDARRILNEGVVVIVSPLDSDARTEIEITEQQERWLEWMVTNGIQQIQVTS